MAKNEEKPTSIFKTIKKVAMLWAAGWLWSMTPERWTSPKRVIMETAYRALMPVIALNPYASLDGTLPMLDPNDLPIEMPPPVRYLDSSVDKKTALSTLRAASENRDMIVIWKNFTQGAMDIYQDEDFIKETFANDKYLFLTNRSNYHQVELPLHDALSTMEQYYLGFSYTLLNRNPRLFQDLNSYLQFMGPEVQSLIPVNASLHHAFMYKGNAYKTGMHQAPVADWFIQLSNGKRWRFVEPKYTPYLRAITNDGIATVSKYDYLPDDTRIPYTDIWVEAGDLMYFPRHWWHEVHNTKDNFGIAFGFRPVTDIFRTPLDVALPFMLPTGDAGHRFLCATAAVKNAIGKLMEKFGAKVDPITTNSNSGIASRAALCKSVREIQRFVPKWSWNSAVSGDVMECPIEGQDTVVASQRVPKDTEL